MSTAIMDQVFVALGELQLQRTASSSKCDATCAISFSQKDERSVLCLRVLICFLDVWKHGPVVRGTRALGVLFVAVHQWFALLRSAGWLLLIAAPLAAVGSTASVSVCPPCPPPADPNWLWQADQSDQTPSEADSGSTGELMCCDTRRGSSHCPQRCWWWSDLDLEPLNSWAIIMLLAKICGQELAYLSCFHSRTNIRTHPSIGVSFSWLILELR